MFDAEKKKIHPYDIQTSEDKITATDLRKKHRSKVERKLSQNKFLKQ